MLVTILHQVIVLHDLGADETFLEIGVNDTCSLRSFGKLANGPTSDLIGTSSEEIDKVQSIIASLDDLGKHGSFFLLIVVQLISLVLSTVRDDFSGTVAINPVLDFLQPFVLFADEVVNTQVDEIYNLLGCDQSVSVDDQNFIVSPVTVADPLVL